MKTKLFLTVVAFSALTVIAAGQTVQTSPQVQPGQGQAAGNAWIDADNDGACDNFENGTRPGRQAYSAGESQPAFDRGPGKGQGLGQAPRNDQGLGQAPRNGQGRHNGIAYGPGKRHLRGRGFMTGRGIGRGQVAMAGRGAGRGQEMMAGRGAGRAQEMMAGRGAGRGQGLTPGRGLNNGQGPAFVDANKDGICDNMAAATEK